MSDAFVRRLLAELGRAAGIDKRVHAHGLRHTFAAELRRECVDIVIIRRQLGHRSLATTVPSIAGEGESHMPQMQEVWVHLP